MKEKEMSNVKRKKWTEKEMSNVKRKKWTGKGVREGVTSCLALVVKGLT